MSNENKFVTFLINKKTFQGKIVLDDDYPWDNIMFKKPIDRREFYEEVLEHKRLERHVLLTKKYCKLKKEYYQFQRQNCITKHSLPVINIVQ